MDQEKGYGHPGTPDFPDRSSQRPVLRHLGNVTILNLQRLLTFVGMVTDNILLPFWRPGHVLFYRLEMESPVSGGRGGEKRRHLQAKKAVDILYPFSHPDSGGGSYIDGICQYLFYCAGIGIHIWVEEVRPYG